MLILLVLILLVVAAIAAVPLFTKVVGPKMIQVTPPSGQPIGEVDFPKPETSVLAVNLDIPVDAMAAAANKEAPREMSDTERKDFHKRVKNGALAWKLVRGDIALQNNGQGISFNLPNRRRGSGHG